MIERFNTCFKTPNNSMKYHLALDSYYFLVKRKYFSSQSSFLSKTGPSYLTYCSKCVFDTSIFQASFGPIFTKKLSNFSAIFFLINSFFLINYNPMWKFRSESRFSNYLFPKIPSVFNIIFIFVNQVWVVRFFRFLL